MSARPTSPTPQALAVESESLNVAVVRGTLSSPPELRTLASGTNIAVLQVTTRDAALGTTSVPVSLTEPAAWIAELEAGAAFLAVGRVVRRFFRAGTTTASRVELAATVYARPSDSRGRRRVARALSAAIESAYS